MSGPSFSNIDLWLFELEEGNLSSSQIQQLELFLMQHPELDVDRNVWEMAKVEANEIIFPSSVSLIKSRDFGWFYFASVASIFLLLFSIPSISNSFSSESLIQISKNNTQSSLMMRLLENEIEIIRNTEISKKNNSNNDSEIRRTSGVMEDYSNNEQRITNGNNQSGIIIDPNITSYEGGSENVVHSLNNELPFYSSMNEDISNEDGFTNSHSLNENGLSVLTETATVFLSDFKRKKNKQTISFQKKLKGFARKVERMANNPVALKNYRDADFHIPGLLINDVNFSSTGTMLSTRFQAMSRIQWLGEDNEQFMNKIALDGYSNMMKGGVGVQLSHSTYGNGGINVSNVAVTYSPKLSLTKTVTFEPSVRFKMGKKILNFDKMENMNHVEIGRQNMQDFYPQGQSPSGKGLWYKDLGVGLMVNTEWFFVSAQLDNLFRHKDNIYENDIDNPKRADFYYSFTAGTDWVSQNKKMSFSPYFVFQKNEKLSEAWIGANYRLNWLTIGAGVSSLMDPIASLGVKFKHFSVQYTADYLSSDMTHDRAISHQVTLRIVGKPNRFGKRILNL